MESLLIWIKILFFFNLSEIKTKNIPKIIINMPVDLKTHNPELTTQIENIFSNSLGSNSPAHQIITIDNRERNSLVPAERYAQGFKLEYQQLLVGDYIINDTIIERKEIKDFTQSVKSQRIFKQLEEIKQYPNYLLIIEGDIYTQKFLHPNSLRGAILSAATSYKIPIIFTRHPKETAQYISILAKKEKKEKNITPIKINYSKKTLQIHTLQTLPSIGPISAKKLIEEFKTLKNIFTLSKLKLDKFLNKDTKKIYDFITQN
jgi:Fanconi anemia group M protein